MNSCKYAIWGFVVIISFLITQCKNDQKAVAKHGELIEKYPSGELEKKYPLLYGKKDGQGLWYYKDGKLRGIMNYKNDLQEGKTEYFYASGNRREVQYYNGGKRFGMDTVWNENGQIFQINQFENGKLQGDQYNFDTAGTMVRHAIFNADTVVKVIDLKK